MVAGTVIVLAGGLVRLERLVRHWLAIMKFFETHAPILAFGRYNGVLSFYSFSSVDEWPRTAEVSFGLRRMAGVLQLHRTHMRSS